MCAYVYIYAVPSISLQTFFVQAFKIVVDSSKFNRLLLYILWDDWPIFTISGYIEQLQQESEYTLLKPDCHNWSISKKQSGREDTLEERYAIKFCFKIGKMPQKCMECFRLLFDHFAWIEHQFLSGIRDSRKAGSLRNKYNLRLLLQAWTWYYSTWDWTPVSQTIGEHSTH